TVLAPKAQTATPAGASGAPTNQLPDAVTPDLTKLRPMAKQTPKVKPQTEPEVQPATPSADGGDSQPKTDPKPISQLDKPLDWTSLLSVVKPESMAAHSVLMKSQYDIDGNQLHISTGKSFLAKQL